MLAVFAVALVLCGVLFLLRPTIAKNKLRTHVQDMGGEIHEGQQFTIVSFRDTPITDDDLRRLIPYVRSCPNIVGMDLSGTEISESIVDDLASLRFSLACNIHLENTAVSESGRQRVNGTPLTPEQVERLKQLLEIPSG